MGYIWHVKERDTHHRMPLSFVARAKRRREVSFAKVWWWWAFQGADVRHENETWVLALLALRWPWNLQVKMSSQQLDTRLWRSQHKSGLETERDSPQCRDGFQSQKTRWVHLWTGYKLTRVPWTRTLEASTTKRWGDMEKSAKETEKWFVWSEEDQERFVPEAAQWECFKKQGVIDCV